MIVRNTRDNSERNHLDFYQVHRQLYFKKILQNYLLERTGGHTYCLTPLVDMHMGHS